MPAERALRVLLVLVGIALLANAATVHAFDMGGDRYRYDTLNVTTTESSISFGSDSTVDTSPDRITGIDCMLTEERPRLCALEAYALRGADGSGTVWATVDGRFEITPDSRSVPEYTRIDGRTHRRRYNLSGGTTAIGFEPVPTDAAVEDVSVERSSLSGAAARVVDDGPVTVSEPLRAHGRVVDTSDGYVIVVGDDDPSRFARPLVQALARIGQFGLGTLLILFGCRSDSIGRVFGS